MSDFSIGDRVAYEDVDSGYYGTVQDKHGELVFVVWDDETEGPYRLQHGDNVVPLSRDKETDAVLVQRQIDSIRRTLRALRSDYDVAWEVTRDPHRGWGLKFYDRYDTPYYIGNDET